MSGKLALVTVVAAFALCFALAGCGGGSAPSSAESNAGSSEAAPSAESTPAAESNASTAEQPSSAAPADDKHNSYFVGKWDLYETEDATHEQVAELMEKYANDESIRAQMNEAYGRDNIEFCARFNADGTGEMDTGAALVPFTWEATNEGAVTFTSFDGKETSIHVPVTDGKFTLNSDTYAKAS